uniref:Amidohydrolase n=1 Tax=Ascaris lumbricoides TaxID=6252 RepID=A0A0M3I0P6_ASCLU
MPLMDTSTDAYCCSGGPLAPPSAQHNIREIRDAVSTVAVIREAEQRFDAVHKHSFAPKDDMTIGKF